VARSQRGKSGHPLNSMVSVASWCSTCFLCRSVCWILYGPFCHGALKLDISKLFTPFFLWTSLQFILLSFKVGSGYPEHAYVLFMPCHKCISYILMSMTTAECVYIKKQRNKWFFLLSNSSYITSISRQPEFHLLWDWTLLLAIKGNRHNAKLQSTPRSVLSFCSCDKVYNKQELCFLLYLLSQIVIWQ